MKQEQSRQQSQQSKSQMSKSPGPNMFMPPRMSQQKVNNDYLIHQAIERFQFRWLKIKGIFVSFRISITHLIFLIF